MLAAVCRLLGASLAAIRAVSRVLGTHSSKRVARMLAVSLLLVDSCSLRIKRILRRSLVQWLPGPGAGMPVRPFRSVSQLILLSVRLDFLRKHGCNLVSAHKLFQEGTLLFLDLLLKFALPRR